MTPRESKLTTSTVNDTKSPKKEKKKENKNCRVFNSADISSDHTLLVTDMMKPITKIREGNKTAMTFDVDNLIDEVITKSFEIKLLLLDSIIDEF